MNASPPDSDDRARESTVLVCVTEDLVQTELVRAALEEAGIQPLIEEIHDTAYDGLFVPQKGWGRVRVLRSDLARAKEALAELDRGE